MEAQKIHGLHPRLDIHPHTQRDSGLKRAKSGTPSVDVLPPTSPCRPIRHPKHHLPNTTATPPQITASQLRSAVEKLSPKKAPGPDEIPNRVLKQCFEELKDHLLLLAQESFEIGHFPTIFKESTTLVLQKPRKPDYTRPNAYRPIALECTIGKVLESITAEMISYLIEAHGLLPPTHFGGRPCRSAEDAMMLLTGNIYAAWRKGEIFSMVFMDVAGAFNNVHHKRLISNLRKRRIPPKVIRWIESFLQGRSTQLAVNGTQSTSFPTLAGIPQGSPLSPTLYILYNADLLEVPHPSHSEHLALGFIDDIGHGVTGLTAKGNVERLEKLMSGAEDWEKKSDRQFEMSKYILIHFTRNRRLETDAAITINGTTIKPTEEAKYLGVLFDRGLKFHAHTNQAIRKGTQFALAIGRIARATWGSPFKYLRRLFTAVTAPRMDYAAVIWHRPEDKTAPTTQQLRKLSTVQRLIMRAITGCFRTTPTAALEHETTLPPPKFRLREKILKAVTRMQTLPPDHPLHKWICQARQNGSHKMPFPSNLENITKHFPEYMHKVETIHPYIRPPWWSLKANIHIDVNKEEAEIHHLQTTTHLKIGRAS